jgi:hypothetical protein
MSDKEQRRERQGELGMFNAHPKIKRLPKGGVTCAKCRHIRPANMTSCPRCEYYAARELDTATKDLIGGNR